MSYKYRLMLYTCTQKNVILSQLETFDILANGVQVKTERLDKKFAM